MSETIKSIMFYALIIFAAGSFVTSYGKVAMKNCGNSYPVDYVFYSNLFCKTEDET